MNRVLIPLSLSHLDRRPPPATSRIEHLAGETMGTTWSVRLVLADGLSLVAIRAGIEAELDRVVRQMSTWVPDSDLVSFNAAPAGTWQVLPEGFFTVVACALDLASKSGGAFDPSVGALVDLWGFGPRPRRAAPPSADDVADALSRCGWQKLDLDTARPALRQPGGVSLDLSAIAKGYGVDRVALFLERVGVESFLVEIGGELKGAGMKPDGSPWWVMLESPATAPDAEPTIVALHGLSIATSGDYRRFFEHGGVRYAHSIDPRTGWPIANRLASVTVMCGSCMEADALSTLLTVLGPDEGEAYAKRYGLIARFLLRGESGGFEERISPAFVAMLD